MSDKLSLVLKKSPTQAIAAGVGKPLSPRSLGYEYTAFLIMVLQN